MAQAKQIRVPGSGLTEIRFLNQPLALCQAVRDVSPRAVAPAQPIQPMNEPRPIEIVTAEAISNGQLTIVLYEEFNRPVWQQIPLLATAKDFVDVSRIINRQNPEAMTVTKHIFRPGTKQLARTITYYGCVIGEIRDDESIDISTMIVPKEIDILYTQKDSDTKSN